MLFTVRIDDLLYDVVEAANVLDVAKPIRDMYLKKGDVLTRQLHVNEQGIARFALDTSDGNCLFTIAPVQHKPPYIGD